MSESRAVILTNMCMVYDNDGNILVQDRVKKNWQGVAFPGGHVEDGESFVESVIREVKEETNLDIKNPVLCGVKQFPQVTHDNIPCRYIVFLYKTNQFSGEIKSSDEGKVFWLNRKNLSEYNLAYDFEKMLEVFDNDKKSEFFCYLENGDWQSTIL